jgi:ubiquinone/menaquinone biosynthesis C-methylase UbiE
MTSTTHLPFQSNQFDFVYMRMVVLHLTPDTMVRLLAEVARILKPGGYFEVVDTDYMIRPSASNILNKINETCKFLDNTFSK